MHQVSGQSATGFSVPTGYVAQVRGLLFKLQAIFDLPKRLHTALEQGAVEIAVNAFAEAAPLLKRYGHKVPTKFSNRSSTQKSHAVHYEAISVHTWANAAYINAYAEDTSAQHYNQNVLLISRRHVWVTSWDLI